MGRIRTIKPEFWSSEQIVECSTIARLLFVGLWNFSDDAGRHPASIKRLKMEVFPGDSFTEDEMSGWMDELIAVGLVLSFESQCVTYWQVTGWDAHQKVDRPNVRFPGPFDEGSTIIRRTLDEHSTSDHPRKGMEGKGISKRARTRTHARGDSPPRFTRPTLPEVTAYCTERRNGIDPQAFLDHYEANGWVVGKSPMKDWRAAIRTWERSGVQAGRLTARASPEPLVAGPGEELAYNSETGEDYVRKIPTRT